MKLTSVRGMRDFLPEDLAKRRLVEARVRELFELYNYAEIETPVLEHFDLFAKKSGEEITQRMYSFTDLSGRKLVLRPEGTAPVARLMATTLRTSPKPIRLGYIWSFFRYDEPQKGRYRQFYQAGFELFGSKRPEADAEIISVSNQLMKLLGFRGYEFRVNSVAVLREVLKEHNVSEGVQNQTLGLIDKRRYEEVVKTLRASKVSQDCIETMKQLFGIKGTDVPTTISKIKRTVEDYGDAREGLEDLETIVGLLDNPPRILIDAGFARGLEYYTGLIFEVYLPGLPIALIGGGRYDNLVETFGGEPTPAVGCAPGIDRLVLAMEEQEVATDEQRPAVVYVVPVGEMRTKAMEISAKLRQEKVRVELEVSGRGLKQCLSYARAREYEYVVIVGPEEAKKGMVILRDMKANVQTELPVERLPSQIKR